MQPEPKKHVSHAIAWSIIILLSGSLAIGIWVYVNQISSIYDDTVIYSIPHNKTSSKPTTATGPIVDWETYTNDIWKFSFKYPASYTISSDNLPKTSAISTGTKDSLVLTDSQDTNKPTLTIYINPAGWGYENYDKEISIDKNYLVDEIKTSLFYAEDTANKSRMAWVNYKSSNSNDYFIMLTKNGTSDYLTEFKNILSTFTFTN